MAVVAVCVAVLGVAPDFFALTGLCTSPGSCPRWLAALDDAVRHLALMVLTGILLYCAFVRVPQHYAQKRLKNNLARHFRSFKEDLIAEMVAVATGSRSLSGHEPLIDPTNFRLFFEAELSPGRSRWHAFQADLDQAALDRILASMKSLRDEITLVVNSLRLPCYAPFEFRKQLSATIIAIEADPDGGQVPGLLADYLWGVFSGRNAVYGIAEQDLIGQTLTAIEWDQALPFTLAWWRKADRKDPISAYETIL